MKLIVGLGNPGQEYIKTRHNAGFMLVEKIATRHSLTGAKHKFHAGILDGELLIASSAGQMSPYRCILMQPTTYMNRSGLAVGEAMTFYKLDPAEDLLVLVDDLALDVGTIRLRGEGSAGGQNGLADIERALGTKKYPRLRIGIGPNSINGHKIPQKDFVLSPFTGDQQVELDHALDKGVKCIESWLTDGLEKTMSLFNAKA
ncbi:MAG: aminoacyl-tRNA hydrolase [Planctomycetota bacterium]